MKSWVLSELSHSGREIKTVKELADWAGNSDSPDKCASVGRRQALFPA